MGPKGFYLLLLLLGLLVLHMKIEESAGFPSGALRIDSAEALSTTAFPVTVDLGVQEFETTTGPFLQEWASSGSGRDALVQKGNIKDNHGLNAKQVVQETTNDGVEDQDDTTTTAKSTLMDLFEHAETVGEELDALTATEVPALEANSTETFTEGSIAELEPLTATEVPAADESATEVDFTTDLPTSEGVVDADATSKEALVRAEDVDLDHPEDCEDPEHGHEEVLHQSDAKAHETNSDSAKADTTDIAEEATTTPTEPDITTLGASAEPQEDAQPTIPPEIGETPTPVIADERPSIELEPVAALDLQEVTSEVVTTSIPLGTADDIKEDPANQSLEAEEALAVQTTSVPILDTENTELSESTIVLVNTTAPTAPADLPPPTAEAIETEPAPTSKTATVPDTVSPDEAPPTQISVVVSEHVKVERTASTNEIVSHGSSYAIVPISNMNMALTAFKHKFNSTDVVPGSVVLEDFTSEPNQIFDAVLAKSTDGSEGARYWFLPMKNSLNDLTTDVTLEKHVIQLIPARNAIHPQAVLIRSQQLNLCLANQGDSKPCIYRSCEIAEMKQQFELKFLFENRRILKQFFFRF